MSPEAGEGTPAASQDQETARHKTARLTLVDRIYATRDRLLSQPSFQRWIARFPLTRGFAQRKERQVFDIIAGFVHTKVLSAAVQLGLLDLLLEEGPLSPDEIQPRIGLDRDATERLLDAALSLGIVSRRTGQRFGLGDVGATVATTPALQSIIAHNEIFYRDLVDPVAILRHDLSQATLARFWSYAHADEPAALQSESVRGYTAFMSASQALIAEDVLDAYPLARHRAVLDVGGGDGTFLLAAGTRHKDLELILFDLPAVCETARPRLEAAGLAQRCRIVGGSFMTDPLPDGADVVVLNRVLLDHDDQTALGILTSVFRTLPPGGRLLVAETLCGRPAGDAYFGMYLMAMGRGRPRSIAAMRALLEAAGFGDIRQLPTYRTTLTNLVSATRPSR